MFLSEWQTKLSGLVESKELLLVMKEVILFSVEFYFFIRHGFGGYRSDYFCRNRQP
jgi:hypothetical protein